MNETKLNIAVVGAGVAGITAAQMLHEKHNVTLFERNDYLGGHTNTIILDDGPDEGTPIDTGFIVFNDRTYPTFQKLLNRLDVDYRKSEMSWSYYDEASDFYYSGSNINGLFARRSNLFNATFLSMVYDIVRFNRQARRDLFNGQLGQDTLESYLIRRRFSRAFVSHYLMPMGAAIWSSAPSDIAGFPAEMYIRFFENHGLLHLTNRPQWYTVEGGSHSYVNKFAEGFNGEIKLCARIESIHRADSGVVILFDDKSSRRFDKVVLATHADQALHLLAQPTDNEKRLLGAWKYSRNRCTLHTDNSLMPPSRRAWSSWNYVREDSNGSNEGVSLTYYMNRLQGLQTERNYFVSLNSKRTLPREKVIREIMYTHPLFTSDSVATQSELPNLNGENNTFFCGSYFGYGFHEDAVKAGEAVGRYFGAQL